MTALKKKAPFIVREVPAELLRRNLKLSKNARGLYLTMLSLADATTGELRLPSGHWLDSRYIAKQAEMGRDKFRKARKELIESDAIADDRPRVKLKPRGCQRWFEVLGESRYRIKAAKNSKNLLKPGFSTVEESGLHTSQKDTFKGADGGEVEFELHPEGVGGDSRQESAMLDDDKLTKFKADVLLKCQDDPQGTLATALQMICERIVQQGISVCSAQYLETCLINFTKDAKDMEALKQRLYH